MKIVKSVKIKNISNLEKSKVKSIKEQKLQIYKSGVKEAVWNRDDHKCIFCHEKVSMFYANAHFIPRSAGGLGIEENIFTACEKCHTQQDNGLNTEKYDKEAEDYLRNKYPNWNKENLIYKKYDF